MKCIFVWTQVVNKLLLLNPYYITHHYRIFDKLYAPLTIFVSLDNGKSLIRQQNIDQTNAGFVSLGHQGKNINVGEFILVPMSSIALTYLS